MNCLSSTPQHFPNSSNHHSSFVHTASFDKEEKSKLLKHIDILLTKNKALEETRQNLQGTVFDLKKLLGVVGNESSSQQKYLHQTNAKLSKKIVRLTNTLKYCNTNGKHLHQCSMYWRQFLQ